MSDSTTKLSKKQLKALKFKSKTSTNAAEELKNIEETEKKRKIEELEKIENEKKLAEEKASQPKKKRKTRRGKGGKKREENSGPRFILFVGNLSYKITEEDILNHFKNCKPDIVRLRSDRGCAFIEFKKKEDSTNDECKKRMDIALRLHHSLMNNRKINVELTAGGGGNSQERREKISKKNEKVEEERNKRIQSEREKRNKAIKEGAVNQKEDKEADKIETTESGIHPDRARLLEK